MEKPTVQEILSNPHAPWFNNDYTEVIVRQDDIVPCIFARGHWFSDLVLKYFDCTVFAFQYYIDKNRLVMWINDGQKVWGK